MSTCEPVNAAWWRCRARGRGFEFLCVDRVFGSHRAPHERIATFVDGHATGHRPSWVRTNAGRTMRDSSSLSVGCGMHNIRFG
ncbi:MAG: hypothetical protein ACK56F_14180, partial [bacterium]